MKKKKKPWRKELKWSEIIKVLIEKKKKTPALTKICMSEEKMLQVRINKDTLRVQPLRKTVWKFCKKLRIQLPYDPEIHPWMYIYI